jgi:hypothetical protein
MGGKDINEVDPLTERLQAFFGKNRHGLKYADLR